MSNVGGEDLQHQRGFFAAPVIVIGALFLIMVGGVLYTTRGAKGTVTLGQATVTEDEQGTKTVQVPYTFRYNTIQIANKSIGAAFGCSSAAGRNGEEIPTDVQEVKGTISFQITDPHRTGKLKIRCYEWKTRAEAETEVDLGAGEKGKFLFTGDIRDSNPICVDLVGDKKLQVVVRSSEKSVKGECTWTNHPLYGEERGISEITYTLDGTIDPKTGEMKGTISNGKISNGFEKNPDPEARFELTFSGTWTGKMSSSQVQGSANITMTVSKDFGLSESGDIGKGLETIFGGLPKAGQQGSENTSFVWERKQTSD